MSLFLHCHPWLRCVVHGSSAARMWIMTLFLNSGLKPSRYKEHVSLSYTVALLHKVIPLNIATADFPLLSSKVADQTWYLFCLI